MYACAYLTTQECKFSTDKQKLALLRPYIVSLAIFPIDLKTTDKLKNTAWFRSIRHPVAEQ